MGRAMGHNRKGGSRGNVDRSRRRNAKRGRDKVTPPRTKTRDEKTPRGKVVPLAGPRRRDGRRKTPRVRPTAGPTRTVGPKRLWTVAAVFVVSGFLLGGRAVHISLTEDEDYRAFAAEQSWDGTEPVPPTRGSIVSADGRELATSLEVARVVATPYQIENSEGTARELEVVIGPETGRSVKEIEAALSKRDANERLMGYSVVATGIKPETASRVQALA